MKRLLYGGLAALGLAVYLWPAFRAPVVVVADSKIDLRWAREGIGVWRPLTDAEASAGPVHAPKAGYLLFLSAAARAFPALGEERSVVVVQSILLWLAVLSVSALVGRRHGAGAGAAAYALLILLPPLRYAAVSVMPEAASAALFLPLGAAAIWSVPTRRTAALAAAALLLLFWIRPNVAGAALLLLCVGWPGRNADLRPAAIAFAAFLGGVLLTWLLSRPSSGSDPARGFPDAVLFGSAEYAWAPALGSWTPQVGSPDRRIPRALTNWKRTLAEPAADRNREIAWRVFHGFLGVDYWDSRWSRAWRAFDHAARTAAPWVVLAALAVGLVAGSPVSRRVAWALVLALIFQSLLIGSSPRYVSPMLPLAIPLAAAAFAGSDSRARLRATAVFGLLAAALVFFPAPASWDFGEIEAADLLLEQRIPKGALPSHGPAVLHIRIASPEQASAARLDISVADRVLLRTLEGLGTRRPLLSVPIPDDVLRESAREPLTLRIRSTGAYGPFSYVLFPILPWPLGRGAQRPGSDLLSPVSDVERGGLDWWAHTGSR